MVAVSDFDIYIVGDTANFDGTDSTDPENDPLAYEWSLDSAPAGSGTGFSDPFAATPTLLLDVVGTYEISLTVSDEIGPGDPDSLTIEAVTAEDYAEIVIRQASDLVSGLDPSQVTTSGNQKALSNFLKEAISALQKGNTSKAIDKLEKARERTDGCVLRGSVGTKGPSRDWVTDCAAQEQLYGLLSDAIDALTP